MVVGKDSKRFSYESFYDDHLKFAVEIPFKGDETLFFKKGEPSGTIYEKLSKALVRKRKLKTLKALQQFMNELSDFYDLTKHVKNGSCVEKKKCQFGTIDDNSGEIMISKKINNELNLHLSFNELKGFYYSKIRASLSRGDSRLSLYELDLRLDQCTE